MKHPHRIVRKLPLKLMSHEQTKILLSARKSGLKCIHNLSDEAIDSDFDEGDVEILEDILRAKSNNSETFCGNQ